MADTIKVKAAEGAHGTHVGSNGQIIHFDSASWAEAGAKEPTILLKDYRRFLDAGMIEKNDDAEKALAVGDDLFFPAGTVPAMTIEQLNDFVDAAVARRLEAMQDAENSVDATTGLSHKALTAYPANQPVGQMQPAEGDPDVPPAGKRGPGRPPKAAAGADAGAGSEGAPAGAAS